MEITETLCYYNGPQIVLAEEKGGKYICLLTKTEPKHEWYLCVRVTDKALADFRAGKIDLLSLYDEDRPLLIGTTEYGGHMESSVFFRSDVPEGWSPDPGFYLGGKR
jgi:hypothetical protein